MIADEVYWILLALLSVSCWAMVLREVKLRDDIRRLENRIEELRTFCWNPEAADREDMI